MNLDLVNDIFNNLKENKYVQNFIKELSNYLENNIKNSTSLKEERKPIIEEILSKNSLTTGNKRSIILNENDIILKYAKQKFKDNSMYFVKDSKKSNWINNKEQYNNDVYTVLKVENDKIEEIEIKKQDMPQNINVNDVFILEDSNYIIDSIATRELQEEIINMAKEIIDKQNKNLEEHRKEGHLYMVSEEIGNNRFLWDLTDTPKNEFEEVNIPQELLDRATQGIVIKYINGKYEYYSDDGFERSANLHKPTS